MDEINCVDANDRVCLALNFPLVKVDFVKDPDRHNLMNIFLIANDPQKYLVYQKKATIKSFRMIIISPSNK